MFLLPLGVFEMSSRTLPVAITCLACAITLAEGPVVSKESPVSLREYRDEVRRRLREHAAAKTKSDEVAAVLPLLEIANRIGADPRIKSSPSLYAQYRRVIARLRAVRKDAEGDLRRQTRKRKPESIKIEPQVLAQLNQAANPNRVANPANAPVVAGPASYAPQLIELIQRTISPQSWDVNGGSSTIQYWRPGMALVVRAPGSIHQEVTPLLGQLRQQ